MKIRDLEYTFDNEYRDRGVPLYMYVSNGGSSRIEVWGPTSRR